MVQITEELLRKRAEHNDGVLRTLREVTLHQYEIERIELVAKLCPRLEILFLQSNLIRKIENLGRLKELHYLNLAVNNIEVVENLEGCESLAKLDLTCNFIDDLTTLESLKDNYNLTDLYMIGNPCNKYEGYRTYVIATLPQLRVLDGEDVEKSERILALQSYDATRASIVEQIAARARDKAEGKLGYVYSPEERSEAYRKVEEVKASKEARGKDEASAAPDVLTVPVLNSKGEILQCNRGNYKWTLQAEDSNGGEVILDVKISRFLDTSLIDVDCQPTYIRVTVKGKVLQLRLPEEVLSDRAICQRSQTTGALLVKMPTVVRRNIAAKPVPALAPLHHTIKAPPKASQAVNIATIVGGALPAGELTERPKPAPSAAAAPVATDEDDGLPPLEPVRVRRT